MTQKPELGTCRTASKPATHWIDNLKPHIKTQNCVGWQALPPSQEGACKHECGFDGVHEICQCVNCGHEWPNKEWHRGESGAGTLRRQRAYVLSDAIDEKDFNLGWDAARKECAEAFIKEVEALIGPTGGWLNSPKALIASVAAAIERLGLVETEE